MTKIECSFKIPEGFERAYILAAEVFQYAIVVGSEVKGMAYGQRVLPGMAGAVESVAQGRILDWMAESMADARREAEKGGAE